MGQAQDSILQVCQLTELKQIKKWEGTQTSSGASMRHSCQKTWESTFEEASLVGFTYLVIACQVTA